MLRRYGRPQSFASGASPMFGAVGTYLRGVAAHAIRKPPLGVCGGAAQRLVVRRPLTQRCAFHRLRQPVKRAEGLKGAAACPLCGFETVVPPVGAIAVLWSQAAAAVEGVQSLRPCCPMD